MHSYLIKIMIVLGALVMIFANAGISPSIMHAATFPPVLEMEIIANNSFIKSLPDPGDVFSAQVSEFPSASQEAKVKVLSSAQPLGSLAAITWNAVAISDDQPVLSDFIKFPEVEELPNQFDGNVENPQSIKSPADSYPLRIETNQVEDLFNEKSYKEDVYCTACHSSPNIGVLTKITHLSGRLIDQQGDPTSIVKCDACHSQLLQQTHRHIRGVE